MRLRLMLEYDRQFPVYGFAGHKGYALRRNVVRDVFRDDAACDQGQDFALADRLWRGTVHSHIRTTDDKNHYGKDC